MILRKPVVEYHVRAYLKAILWFVGIYMGIYLLSLSLAGVTVYNEGVHVGISGIEFAFGLFFMICAMATYREENNFLLQHGVSRKAIFSGFAVSALIAAAIGAILMVLIDEAARGLLAIPGVNVRMDSLFLQLFGSWVNTVGRVPAILVNLLWIWLLFLVLSVLGYFLANLYYRLSKLGKVLLPVGAGVLVISLPPILFSIGGGRVGTALLRWINWMFVGRGEIAAPANSMIVFSLFTLVFLPICWLFVRRFQVKK